MIKKIIRPYLVLAALAFGCSEAEKINPVPEAVKEIQRYPEQLIPSLYAVKFCENLAEVVAVPDEVFDFIESLDDSCYVVRTANFVKPVNEFYHQAGSVSCRYQHISPRAMLTGRNRFTPAQRDLVSSIFLEDSDIGNPDYDFEEFLDNHVQDLVGNPLENEQGNPREGADGILDGHYGGTMGGGRGWLPEDSIFPLIQDDYSKMMEFLDDQLHAGILRPANQFNQRWDGE